MGDPGASSHWPRFTKAKTRPPNERGGGDKGSAEQALIDAVDKLLQRHCRQLVQRLEAQQHELLERLAVTTANQQFESPIPVLEEEEELPDVAPATTAIFFKTSDPEELEPRAAAVSVTERPRTTVDLDGNNELCAVEEAVNARFTFEHTHHEISFSADEQARQRASLEVVKKCNTTHGSLAVHRKGPFRERLTKMVNSCCFETGSCFLIFASVLFFGIETQYMAQNRIEIAPYAFVIFSRVFAAIFTVELVLHVLVEGSSFFTSEFWISNVLDVIIVFMALLEIALGLILGQQGGKSTNLTHICVIRLIRTVRVLRVVRIMKLFRSLRILVYSVLNTLKSLLWVIFMILLIIYIFALLFTQAANEYIVRLGPEPEGVGDLSYYFGSVPLSVYTLFKVITGGLEWEVAAIPLESIGLTWVIIFIGFVAFSYFALLNVVMGLVCQTAIESAHHDLDVVVQTQLSNQEQYTKKFKDLFKNIDLQHTGILTLKDLEERLQDPRMQDYFAAMDLTTIEAWTLFKLLDANDSAEIDVDEFVTGCLRLRGNARSIDMHMLMYESKWMLKQLATVVQVLKKQDFLLNEQSDQGEELSISKSQG